MLSPTTPTRCAASAGKALSASVMRTVFIDPIFSFGVTVTMREAEFAAPLVREHSRVRGGNGENPFARDHQVFCEKAIDNLEDMIDLFWEQPFAFATFVYHRYPDQID